jgi:hypothetical protein
MCCSIYAVYEVTKKIAGNYGVLYQLESVRMRREALLQERDRLESERRRYYYFS